MTCDLNKTPPHPINDTDAFIRYLIENFTELETCAGTGGGGGGGGYTLAAEWGLGTVSGATLGEFIGLPAGWSEVIVAFSGLSSTGTFESWLQFGSTSGYTTTVVGDAFVHNQDTVSTWSGANIHLHTDQNNVFAAFGLIHIIALDPSAVASARMYEVVGQTRRENSKWDLVGTLTAATAEIDRVKIKVSNGTIDGTPRASIWYRSDSPGNLITVTTTPYTAASFGIILVDDDAIGGAAVVDLPPASGSEGLKYTVVKIGNTASATLDGAGTEKINGQLTKVLSAQWDAVEVVCDGTQWVAV